MLNDLQSNLTDQNNRQTEILLKLTAKLEPNQNKMESQEEFLKHLNLQVQKQINSLKDRKS